MPASHSGPIAIGLFTSLSRSVGRESSLARALGLAGILAKPCDRQELLADVRDALDRDPA